MKLRLLLPLALATGAAISLFVVQAQQKPGSPQNVLVPQTGQGKPYGTRDPYKCSSTVAPKTGAITPELAAQYVTCNGEYIDHDGALWLNMHAQIRVGRGVPAMGTSVATAADVDPNELVYPIRGTLDRYLCYTIDHGRFENQGKNCSFWHWDQATGHCYRTTFGDWKCFVSDIEARQVANQPPPAN